MSTPPKKEGRKLDENIKSIVIKFYEDGKYSRIMPDSKNYVSVGKKQHMQERLLLVNLKELYISFLKEHAEIKIGFSKFCQLRPKRCVLMGASGNYCVSFCTYHQNMKLILDILNLEYKNLLRFLACDPGNKHCMIHWCPNCPDNEEQLYLYLKETTESLNISYGKVKFYQWATTDRANLNYVGNIETYIENVIKKVQSITVHSYSQNICKN